MKLPDIIPLIIDGEDYIESSGQGVYELPSGHRFQGASLETCDRILASSAKAYESWSRTTWQERRGLLFRLAQILRDQVEDVKELQMDEISTDPIFASIITQGSIEGIEETASLLMSEVFTGHIQPLHEKDALGLVIHEPLGAVLSMAPWNAPTTLGFRAIVAPIAAGNTVIFKGSEMSPRTHYVVARLFREAGFPPGVVNFVLHSPEDAKQVFDRLIEHDIVQKCTFTGSTGVGRSIAAKCGSLLKPVLLELGGKNISIVLEDADLERAAEATILGATLNNGQICMSTDTVFVVASISARFNEHLHRAFDKFGSKTFKLVQSRGRDTANALVDDALSKGATVHTNDSAQPNTNGASRHENPIAARLVTNLTPAMKLSHTESFAPLIGSVTVSSADEAVQRANESGYGLSSAIWTARTHEAVRIAKLLRTGAVHVNGMTVHDEATLPHGGVGLSGYGRFNAQWGLREFLKTKTIVLNP